FREVSPVFAHQMTEFADDTIAIGGDRLDQHAHAARSIAFEGHFLVLLTFELAGTSKYGPLDVFIRHILILAGQDGCPQSRVRVGVSAADASGNGNFADDAG